MPLYELLVVAEGINRGKIVHKQLSPAQWGKKEGPPTFTIVQVELPEEHDLLNCTWDFTNNKIIGNTQKQVRTVLSQPAEGIDIIVVTHAKYLDWLPGCMDSIDRQNFPGQRILMLDMDEPQRWLMEYPHWQVIYGNWNNPSLARNTALPLVNTEWVVFFDADNIMCPGYLQSFYNMTKTVKQDIAIIYPRIQQVDANLLPLKHPKDPIDYDYWKLRHQNFIDTSSCWRVAALRACGGWVYSYATDDWATALMITQNGWRAQKNNGVSVWMRMHDRGQRRYTYSGSGGLYAKLSWGLRTFSVVTLLAPNRHPSHLRWLNWVCNADLPKETSLIIVDNRQCEQDTLIERAMYSRDWSSVKVIRDNTECPGRDFWSIHSHVARLYRRALVPPPTDLILTIEDDVEPPLDALRILHENYSVTNRIGAISAVYAARGRSERVVASTNKHMWNSKLYISDIEAEPTEVGMVGGGCTLWSGWALQQAMPIEPHRTDKGVLGWDGALCNQLQQAGYSILLDGRVRCKHYANLANIESYDKPWWDSGEYYS